uniref:tRNA modification GTPase n=1 Tax=Flavobacterium sp. TaxID=239 RepID=UPI004049BF5A
MKHKLTLLLGLFLTLNSFSQISFEKGYFINNSGEKIECLIKNKDWKNNPTEFEYIENNQTKVMNIKFIEEFSIYNTSKYLRVTVNIDRSSENISDLSEERNPIFNEEQLFLKVLVEGKANLYFYEDPNVKRYFYNLDDSQIEQLIFKTYKVSFNIALKNNQFRQQLFNDLKCNSNTNNSIENLDYKKNSLVNYFIAYNKCNNSNVVNYELKNKRDFFNLTIRPRLNSSSLKIDESRSNLNKINFDNTMKFGFGIEAEFILPYNKNKWGIIFEPSFQSFNAEKTINATTVSGGKLNSKVDYSSIEIPIGIRHYFFLNNNSKIFLNASYVYDYNLKSSIKFKRLDNSSFKTLEIQSKNNLSFGLGFKLNDKYVLELRTITNRELLGNNLGWNSGFSNLSFIFGYSIF